ncbi:MAG TPA: hypothetical protein VIK99_01280 [Thermaerobacter sp.]
MAGTTKVQVKTEKYEIGHGKRPRGVGYWAFRIGEHYYVFYGSYGEAKARAVALAINQGEGIIEVLP